MAQRVEATFRAFALVAILAVNPVFAQRGSHELAPAGESIDEMISDFMREHEIAGMAVAIVQAPYITRATGHGLSDTETRRLVAANTVFGLGEMAEAYVAVAVMQLVEMGKASLDDPIERHVAITPKGWHGITVRQLMQHQSGLPDFPAGAFSPGSKPEEALGAIANSPAVFPPGTQARWSATDYVLLQWLIEAASGESYERFVRTHQIERLGLRHTFFATELESVAQEKLAPDEKHRRFLREPALINPTEPATGYRGSDSVVRPLSGSPLRQSALYASAADISIWDIGLAGDILIKDPALRKILYTPATLRDGTVAATSGPWWFPGRRGLMIATGSGGGFSALLSRFTDPKELVCVTLLANQEGVDLTQLARRIAGVYDPALGPPQTTRGTRAQESPYSPTASLDRLEAALRKRGAGIIARIDHAKAAAAASLQLAATEEIIFGNPAAGTILMQANPAVAVDLPLRVVAWQRDGATWLSGVDPVEIARRHGIDGQAALTSKMRATLDAALLEAVSPWR